MDMHHVDSTNIAKAGYEDGVMVLEFRSGGTYTYVGVSEDMFQSMLSSPSPGSFFSRHILPRHRGKKLG